jgi:hypothetical protein
MSDILVYNPLPWDRELSGTVSAHVADPRGRIGDPTASRHHQDRGADGYGLLAATTGHEGPLGPDTLFLPPTPVPGRGWTTVPTDRLADPAEWSFDERATVEGGAGTLRFDRERGGVASWRHGGRELVDADREWPLAGFVHERVADGERADPRRSLFEFRTERPLTRIHGLNSRSRGWNPDWHAERRGPDRVARHRVYDTPAGPLVRQRLETPVGDVFLAVLVGETVEIEAAWEMGLSTHPEATYLAFPFAIGDPTHRVDVGGQAVRAGTDQLDRTCHDYYTAQRWVDVSGPGAGVTVGCPLNPLVQFGGFSFGANRERVPADPLLLGWVTNNYWETNFRARQPGAVRARYRLHPHGGFDESAAHRRGLAAEHADPAVHRLGEPGAEPVLPDTGRFLDLPDLPVLVVGERPAWADGVHRAGGDGADATVLHLRNASDEARTATVGPGALAVQSATRADAFGRAGEPLSIADGGVAVDLAPRETTALRLDCAPR